MTSCEEGMEEANERPFPKVNLNLKDRSKKVAETKEKTKKIISEHAVRIAKQAEEHEQFINKVTYFCGVLGFGGFCFLLGARPQDVPYVYCVFYVTFVPLRWVYYRYKKWHYYLLDFCYYANTIFLVTLIKQPRNEKLFMVCFSFAEGPLAWAIIVWRCSLVFNSIDKITSVLIHLLPGMIVLRIYPHLKIATTLLTINTSPGADNGPVPVLLITVSTCLVFFTIRWWNPVTFTAMQSEGTAQRTYWPDVESRAYLWQWLFLVPLVVYTLWQIMYFLIVEVLRRQRFLKDPEIMTSYRELSKKAQKANNLWWRLSGSLGDQNRLWMYIILQALFTVATTALTVPIFLSYELHVIFQILKVSAAVWNGGSFVLDVMPRQVILKEKKKSETALQELASSPITPADSVDPHNHAAQSSSS